MYMYSYISLDPDSRAIENIDLSATIPVNISILIALTGFLMGAFIIVLLRPHYQKYDIFFSAPMSFQSDEEFKSTRDACLKIIEKIKSQTKYKKIYYAAEGIESMSQFNAGNHAVLDDLVALRKSRRFLLYLPKKVATSAIFEAGYALRKNMPTVYFCHNDSDLPFLMRDLNDTYRSVRKYEAKSVEQLCGFVDQCKDKLFTRSI